MQSNLINVVFTGPAFDRAGNQVFRADLTALAEKNGYRVQSAVNKDTHAVVASRDDTVKAAKARQKGLIVTDYPSFIDSLGGVVEKHENVYHWIVDGLKAGAKAQQLQLDLDLVDATADYL